MSFVPLFRLGLLAGYCVCVFTSDRTFHCKKLFHVD